MAKNTASGSVVHLVLASLTASACAAVFRVPVQRVAGGGSFERPPVVEVIRVPDNANESGETLASHLTPLAIAMESASVELHNRQNLGYSGTIRVGTPGQDMTVVFDTGSANFWVPSRSGAIGRAQFFDQTSSSTCVDTKLPFAIEYGSGNVSGVLVQDRVEIGDVVLRNFTFAEATNTSGIANYEKMGFDGVLGLGFPAIVEDNASTTVMGALVKSGRLDEPVFGFYLGDKAPGQFVLGGVDPEHYVGEFRWLPVTHEAYWQVQMDSVRHASSIRVKGSNRAIVDSGTSLLVGPKAEVEALAAMMGAHEVKGLYMVVCNDTAPGLIFDLAGQDYIMSQGELTVEKVGDYCILGMQYSSLERPMWILGDVFMRKYYVQFDFGRKRVGFALAARSAAERYSNLV